MRLQIHRPHPLQTLHDPDNLAPKLRQPASRQGLLRATRGADPLRAAESRQAVVDVGFEALEEDFEHGVGEAVRGSLGEEARGGGGEVRAGGGGHVVGGGEDGGCFFGGGGCSGG